MPSRARIAAAALALVAFAGLAIQFSVSLGKTGAAGAALWSMLRFFTIIGNGATVAVFAGVALGFARAARPGALGGITLIMALIGIVYTVLLRNTEHLIGAAYVATVFMHYIVPPLVALWWLGFAPKGGLVRLDPLRWAILPLAYFPYGLARGAADGRYPYPFMDAARLGWPQVLVNAAMIAAGFLLLGYALLGLDRMLARRRVPASRAAAP